MGQAVRRTWCRGVAVTSVFLATVVLCLVLAGVANAYVYWANDGATSTTIGRANLNGTGANENFITGGNVPCFVAVDASHVYWANTNGTTIGRANLNGTGVNQNFITGANAPCGVAVEANYIYWGNSGGTTVGRANLDGTGAKENFITGATEPCGVAVDVYQPDAQIKLASDRRYLGVGIINTTGAGQTRSTTTARGKSATFDLRFVNDGTLSDAIAVHGVQELKRLQDQILQGHQQRHDQGDRGHV